MRGGETNYIMATLGLFLNVYNIFISLLNLLLAFTGSATDCAQDRIETGRSSAPVFLCARTRAIDSTCAVCGNMLTTPAAARR